MDIKKLDRSVKPIMAWYRHKEYMELKDKIREELLSPSMYCRTFSCYDEFMKTINYMRSDLMKLKFIIHIPCSGHVFNFEVIENIDDYIAILEWELFNHIQFVDMCITYVDPEEPWKIS
jgi:hypothetical protein